jgi:hypothetical protein
MLITSQDDLLTNRTSSILDILSAIASNKKLNVQQISLKPKIVFAVSDIFEKGQDFTEWRFRTCVTNYNASYYEIWTTKNYIDYSLTRAYFHLYCTEEDYCKITPNGEYLLLHCDPNENDLIHGIYKRNPHLHVKTAKHPFPHAHIALNLYSADQIYGDIEEFSKSIKQSIKMINDQILNELFKIEYRGLS